MSDSRSPTPLLPSNLCRPRIFLFRIPTSHCFLAPDASPHPPEPWHCPHPAGVSSLQSHQGAPLNSGISRHSPAQNPLTALSFAEWTPKSLQWPTRPYAICLPTPHVTPPPLFFSNLAPATLASLPSFWHPRRAATLWFLYTSPLYLYCSPSIHTASSPSSFAFFAQVLSSPRALFWPFHLNCTPYSVLPVLPVPLTAVLNIFFSHSTSHFLIHNLINFIFLSPSRVQASQGQRSLFYSLMPAKCWGWGLSHGGHLERLCCTNRMNILIRLI